MVMAPLNVQQVLPDHHQNGHCRPQQQRRESRKKHSTNGYQHQQRPSKKFLVFPVEDIQCQPCGQLTKCPGRIVTGKPANAWTQLEAVKETNGGEAVTTLKEIQQKIVEGRNARQNDEESPLKKLKDAESEHNRSPCASSAQSPTIIEPCKEVPEKELFEVPAIAKPRWTTPPPAMRAKVILLGESGVGKTSLLYSLKFGCSEILPCHPTIGPHYVHCDMTALGNVPVQLQLWDTAGQERFRAMVPMYLRNVNAALIVYDLTSRRSFEEVDFWAKEVWRCTASEKSGPALVLVASKRDKQDTLREVAMQEGQAKADQLGAKFYEVSAMETEAIRSLFHALAEHLADQQWPPCECAQEVNEQLLHLEEESTDTTGADDGGIRLDQRLAHDVREWTALWGKAGFGDCCAAQ